MMVTFEGMTAEKSNALILDMLDNLNDSDMFACESIAEDMGMYWPMFYTNVKCITVEAIGTGCNVAIEVHNGVTLYGKAEYYNRFTCKMKAFSIYGVELEKF